MEYLEHHHKHRFMSYVLQMLHLKTDIFMYNLAHQQPYELLVYSWINKLYDKGTPKETAVQLIYKARNILLLNPKNGICNAP